MSNLQTDCQYTGPWGVDLDGIEAYAETASENSELRIELEIADVLAWVEHTRDLRHRVARDETTRRCGLVSASVVHKPHDWTASTQVGAKDVTCPGLDRDGYSRHQETR